MAGDRDCFTAKCSSAVLLSSRAASFVAAEEQLQRDLEIVDADLLSLFDKQYCFGSFFCSWVGEVFFDSMNHRKKIGISVSDLFEQKL